MGDEWRSQEPVIRATCNGVPIYAYGYTHVLAESPDLVADARIQRGNRAALTKIRPRPSGELGHNFLGTSTPRMPRMPANDYLPLEAIHLIDGDPETCWSSRTLPQADAEPVWIRIDLPMEQAVSRLVLRKRPAGAPRAPGAMPLDQGAVEVGRAIPGRLTVRTSRDGWHWETVFDGESGDGPERETFECTFDARPAKQIWVIGDQLQRVENWLFAFSIGEVEVVDADGNNLALATRGAAVTVSSTQHSMGQTIEAHRWLWPLHWELGLQWARVGFHDDPVNWHWVEQERGVLAVDPAADAAITELAAHGVDVVLALGFGNRLYTQQDGSRKLPQLWEWYYENPLPPTTPEALSAWGRFVRYMARHFRDRVTTFEIWNEWNIPVYWGGEPELEHYLAVARVAIPIVREECPHARIALGSVAGFCYGLSEWPLDQLLEQDPEGLGYGKPVTLFLQAIRELVGELDVVTWHPNYQKDPEAADVLQYAEDVRAFQRYCEALGFRGEYMVTEFNYGANYPPTAPPNWWGTYQVSEMEKAKLIARTHVQHTGLGVGSFVCETWTEFYPLEISLLRRSFAADPISPLQPEPAYYVMRNLATALDDLRPVQRSFRVEGDAGDVEAYALGREGEMVLALWRPGRVQDRCEGWAVDVVVDGAYAGCVGYDPLNGTTQVLQTETDDGQIRLAGIMLRDYPILVRLRHAV